MLDQLKQNGQLDMLACTNLQNRMLNFVQHYTLFITKNIELHGKDVQQLKIHQISTTFITTIRTTTPTIVLLTRNMGRSNCEQLYPFKYHYSQRG